MQGFHGLIQKTATIELVQPATTTTAISQVVSLSIVKLSDSIGSARYVAVGKAANGMLVPLAGKVAWSSSNPQAIRVDASGVARAMAAGKATLTATYSAPDGTTAVGKTEFGSLGQN